MMNEDDDLDICDCLHPRGDCPFDKYRGVKKYKGVDVNYIDGWTCEPQLCCFLDAQKNEIKNMIVKISFFKGTLQLLLKENRGLTYQDKMDDINWFFNHLEGAEDVKTTLSTGSHLRGEIATYYSCDGNIHWCSDVWVVDVGLTKDNYHKYLESDEWKTKSQNFKTSQHGFCALCNTWVGIENLETHHKKYPKNLKDDKQENWIAICKVCHGKLHGVER